MIRTRTARQERETYCGEKIGFIFHCFVFGMKYYEPLNDGKFRPDVTTIADAVYIMVVLQMGSYLRGVRARRQRDRTPGYKHRTHRSWLDIAAPAAASVACADAGNLRNSRKRRVD